MRLDELHNEIKMEKLQEVIDLQEYDAKKQASPGGQRGNRAFYQGGTILLTKIIQLF